jgi:hypothetical protein
MAKPLNPYQGAAPAAMGQMGQGILEAGARIGQTIQSGYESMGKGLASGITAAASAYAQNKEEQGRFDATKKMFKAYESYLPQSTRDEIDGIFSDTTMSVSQKNAMAPMLLNFLAASQQQQGREKVAGIMTESREAIAAAKNPPRPERPAFNVSPTVDPLDLPVGAFPAAPQMFQQMPPAQGAPSLNAMPKVRQNPVTGEMEFWSPGAKRYVPEP